MGKNAHHDGQKSLNHNMKAASIVNGAYFVEQCNRLRKQLKPIARCDKDRNTLSFIDNTR